MSELTYSEAADHLNVSPATIKNWKRQGILSKSNTVNLLESDILQLKKELSGNKSRRLISRANKSSANRKFIPTEYIEKRMSRKAVKRLSEDLNSIDENSSQILFSLSIQLIKRAGLISDDFTYDSGVPKINHKNLSREIESWYQSLNKPSIGKLIKKIGTLNIPYQRDTSGLIYQMLQNEGRKSEKGSYYTPPGYADEVLELYGKKDQRFLDPCCGSGMFLLAAAQKYGSPENIFGWDTDDTAVRLARINLMLHFKELDFEPAIKQKNCLTEENSEKFDLIATNPPWGHHFSKKDQLLVKNKYKTIKTGESFSYFIEAGLNLLMPEGILSYLLPEALLKVKTHRDIRENILKKVHVKYLKFLGKPFYRVQTQVIRMDLENDDTNPNTTVYRNNQIYSVNCKRFLKNPFFLFDFNCTQRDYAIIDKVYEIEHKTLLNNAIWILGIVSGNNDKFISFKQKEKHKPFISGKDLQAFKIGKLERYIFFDRKVLQQSAPLENYQLSPKIVYKFISDRIVFAIDRFGTLTLNSANSVYPQMKMSIETITALFNSSLYQYINKKKFNSVKVLRGHLEQLPIPKMTKKEDTEIQQLVLALENSEADQYLERKLEIDEIIFQYFHISDRDRKYIMENL